MFKDYYLLLEISENATNEEIKSAFRKQAIKWHPDKNPNLDTTNIMQELNEAYIMLKDPEARARYDKEYQKYKGFKNEKEKSTNKTYSSKEKEPTNTPFSEYKIEDDILENWIKNAKKQAKDLVEQTIKDFRGVSNAAGKGLIDGIIQVIIWIVLANVVFFIVKSCK